MKRWLLLVCLTTAAQARSSNDSAAARIAAEALGSNHAIAMLRELTLGVGPRLSGSAGYDAAVAWGTRTMRECGLDQVRTESLLVPHWERGTPEEAFVVSGPRAKPRPLRICALGGSVGTPVDGITAEVVVVRTFAELHALGERARGRIVFFNRPMERTLLNTFEAYGRAVDQRSRGAIEAAAAGGVAALVRSMSTGVNDFPHTGATHYLDTIPPVPAAAISTRDAEFLDSLVRAAPGPVRVTLRLACRTLPDAPASNVLGQLTGTEHPEEVIVIGGHLDSWDKGQGAHDDGAGCVQAIEALHILRSLGLQPKRTIRAVLFANEENGLRGGTAYADTVRNGERHIAAIESDEGGFAPRGFGVGDSAAFRKIKIWESLFRVVNADRITYGGGGGDIGPLARKGAPGIGLNVETQRYFDYHHSDNDTIDKVNERELALGAAAMALMAWLIAQEGLSR